MRTSLLLLFLLVWSACGGASDESAGLASSEADYDAAVANRGGGAEAPEAAPPPAPARLVQQAQTQSPVADTVGLKIIRTATLRLRVDDYARARAALDAALKGFDAYVSNENESRGYGGLEGQLTVRVAARQFQPLLDQMIGLAEEVAYKEITAEDVTEQYVDVQARLRAKRAVEQRYLELLAQARTVEDILNVENNLRVIREELESMEGRLRYLQDRVGYSTIHLTLFEGRIDGGNARPFWSRLADAFAEGWDNFLGLVVWVIEVWPLWLVLFVVFVPLRRAWRAWRTRRSKTRERTGSLE